MKICHFGFRMINSMPKMLALNTLTLFFFTYSSFMNYVKLKRNSIFSPRKRCLSCHHTMHYFHTITPVVCCFMNHTLRKSESRHHTMHHFQTITPIILLFRTSRLEKVVNYAISPTSVCVLH